MNNSIITLLFISVISLFTVNSKADSILTDSVPSSGHVTSRVFQISFVPFLGTNGIASPNIVNNISLNILAGYNGGTTSFEAGGLFNINRYDVKATQLAGIGNFTGGETNGVQVAGIINTSKIATGTQIAGISNISIMMDGVQIAGINNHAKGGESFQISGIINTTEDQSLSQIAGIANYAKSCSGVQIGGIVNTSKWEAEAQFAGIANYARSSNAVQVAGIVNATKENTGSQIAGILNIARSFKGVQIGLINIADSSSGIPIGLINVIKNGYNRFEISADEIFQANLAYRSGVEKFHAIITAGIKPKNIGAPLWTYGVGAGISEAISSNTMLDFDVTFSHVIKKDNLDDNFLYKAYFGIDRSLSSRVSLSLGATYNFLVTDVRGNLYREHYSDIAPYSFSDHSNNHFNLKTWLGFKAGLRFR